MRYKLLTIVIAIIFVLPTFFVTPAFAQDPYGKVWERVMTHHDEWKGMERKLALTPTPSLEIPEEREKLKGELQESFPSLTPEEIDNAIEGKKESRIREEEEKEEMDSDMLQQCMWAIFLMTGGKTKSPIEINLYNCIWILGLLGTGRDTHDPYEDLVGSLNESLLNKEVPDVSKAIGVSTLENEKINVNILVEPAVRFVPREEKYLGQIGIIIENSKVVKISKGAITDATINVEAKPTTINKILKARTSKEAINLVLASIRDGSLRVAGVGPINSLKFALAQGFATVFSKFQSYPFDVSKGQTKTVNFVGTEAKLEQNALGQRIVSVGYSDVVFRVSKGGEMLGYSTKGTQKLVKADTWGFGRTSGYYGNVPTHYYNPYRYVAWPR